MAKPVLFHPSMQMMLPPSLQLLPRLLQDLPDPG
jgi:hypothetical protein